MFNKPGTPYPKELLPEGFKYPERYLRISEGLEEHERTDWDYEDANSSGGRLTWELRNIHSEWKNVGDRELIPFAQLMDDAAFFDGTDTSGNPRVICLDLSNKHRTYEFENFDAWLKFAIGN